jgi:hypothetical protein
MMGILQAAHTGQVGGTITAPVTKEACDFWLPICHISPLKRWVFSNGTFYIA